MGTEKVTRNIGSQCVALNAGGDLLHGFLFILEARVEASKLLREMICSAQSANTIAGTSNGLQVR